ncbi:PREDICTED: charged multivesicular body protein 7 [Dinoponera quadriceps]|uniref:Charged multivesicular body protein 7 n=1 Tax=Dinoponera quadriceps TaxID=609295 RepID=A0A6P3YDY0_DINQU|nr:PREDICTED: charged multivesicular body protein 7 [Dinoponera quadriceps]XP_014488649.1 PREDICTED: charged multivesicular body protein 7 [Dinoponera quadriceps]XP_014488650.1 PREDICTED: charged multivesicular body protein 7 [Dinoponera quadriceps]
MNDENISNNLLLSPEKVTEYWNQEERMNALFSPFRSKSANSQDWISKYKFWRDLIYKSLKHTMQCTFSIVDLNEAFKRKGCVPLCLDTVIEELLRHDEIIQETDFLKEPCETWTAWSVDTFLRKPISWSFYKMKTHVLGQNTINTEVKYIHIPVMQELGDIILSIAEIKKNNVLYSVSEITEYCKIKTKKQISEDSVKLVLEWLRRKRKVALGKSSDSNNELLVKISTHLVTEITEVEEGTYKLVKQENKLIKEIEFMEQEKLNILNEIKTHMAKGLRQLAKTCLKRKIELEKIIEKRSQVLANLHILIINIEDAHSNSAILSAYKTGSEILKKMEQKDLTQYSVMDVMDNINELLEENREINVVLSETLNQDSDTELERELAELMNENDADISTTFAESNSEIENLEQRLNNLRMNGSLSLENTTTLPSVSSHGNKILQEPECL